MKKLMIGTIAALALPFPALAQSLDVAALRDAALADTLAYDLTESLTTEVGPRLAGTEAEARARDWAVARLTALGFSNVRAESFTMPVWVRGEEKAFITAPFPQPLAVTALGNSGSTGDKGIEGEIVFFPSFADLQAAPDGSLKGKIAYISHAMRATQDGSHYGAFGAARRQGPGIASQKGAAAILIRSIGTDHHRNPHTGVMTFPDGVKAIPAGALALPDADQLERVLKRGKPVTMKLVMTPRQTGNHPSGNVIAEVPGRDPAAGIVLVACHLDSWDLGTGAFDDAAGCGIVAAAAKRIMDGGGARRTIRVLFAGAEEVGIHGGRAYADAHKSERHVVAAESDFGADRIWRFDTSIEGGAAPVAARLATALAPLGINRGSDSRPGGGADIGPVVRANGVAVIDLQQDGSRYFDLHHTPDDTLDKIDPVQLRQNVAAWTAMLAVTADATEDFPVVSR
ncbi:M28 family peptidase [Sphingomonas sp. CJ99]